MAEDRQESDTTSTTMVHINIDTNPSPGSEPSATAGESGATATDYHATKTSQSTKIQWATTSADPLGQLFDQGLGKAPDAAPLSGGAILGIVLGSISVIVGALCASRFYIRRRNREKERKRNRTRPVVRAEKRTAARDIDHKKLPELPPKD